MGSSVVAVQSGEPKRQHPNAFPSDQISHVEEWPKIRHSSRALSSLLVDLAHFIFT